MSQGSIREQVLARYPILLSEANLRMSEPWFSVNDHTHERSKFTSKLSTEILSSFRGRRYGGIGLTSVDFAVSNEIWVKIEAETLVNPRSRISDYDKVLGSYVLHFIKDLVEKARDFPGFNQPDLLKLIVDNQRFGAEIYPVKAGAENLPVSIFSARMATRTLNAMCHYQNHSPTPIKTVLELGGGFGRCLRDCISISEVETAYYVDLPLNVGLAAFYLDACFPGRVNLVWDAQDQIIPGKINILAPWLIDKIDGPICLMINFLSLHHMPQVTMDYYFRKLICPKIKFLYHENRMQPRSKTEGEGSLLNVDQRKQFTIHAGREMNDNMRIDVNTGKTTGQIPTVMAEFLINKKFQG